MRNTIFGAALAIAMSLPVLTQAQGTIYVSNLDQTPIGSLAVGSDSWIAQGFYILPSDPKTYVLNSIQLLIAPATGSPSGFSVSIYSRPFGSTGDIREHYVGTLSGSPNPVNAGVYTYEASGITLSSSESYDLIVTGGTPVAHGTYGWSAVDGGIENGSWDIANGYASSSDGMVWVGHVRQGALQMAINATPIPEPATWVLAGLGFLLLVIRRCQTRRSTRF